VCNGHTKGYQEHDITEVMGKMHAKKASQHTCSQIFYEIILGKMGSDVYNEAKKVCPLRHVGVRKSKLLSMPLEAMQKAPEVKPVEEEIVAPIAETPAE